MEPPVFHEDRGSEKAKKKTRAPQFVGRHLGVGCRTGWRLQIFPLGRMLVVRAQLLPQSSLERACSREPAGARRGGLSEAPARLCSSRLTFLL